MDTTPAPTKFPEFRNTIVRYESFHGVMEFFYNGEKIYQKTVEECEKIFPHIRWHVIKKNQYTTYEL